MNAIDPHILSVIEEVNELRKSRPDHMQIPRIEGDLLYHIALSNGARLIVEIGTSYGFSGLFWAAALRKTGGRLHTIDINPAKFEASRKTFAQAAVADIVTGHLGDARKILPDIDGPVDVAFIDADKPSCRAYFDLLWPKLRPGGSILTDNATTHRAELADYIAYVRGRQDASSVEVPVGNGVEWTVKLR